MSTADSSSSPEARLQASRTALRAAMQPQVAPSSSGAHPTLGARLAVPARVAALLAHPVAETLRDTVRQWWRNHPWRPVVTVGIEAARQAMVPLARRHPGRLLGGAMLAGAVFSRWRPWKWVISAVAPTLLVSMIPTLLNRLAARVPAPVLLRLIGIRPAERSGATARAQDRATTTTTTVVRTAPSP